MSDRKVRRWMLMADIRKKAWDTDVKDGPFSDITLIRRVRWPGRREHYVCTVANNFYVETTISIETSRDKAIGAAEKVSNILGVPVSYQNMD